MKKIITLLSALTFIFILVACSNQNNTESEPYTSTTTTQSKLESTDTTSIDTTKSNNTSKGSSAIEIPSNSIPSNSNTSSPENSISSKTNSTTDTSTKTNEVTSTVSHTHKYSKKITPPTSSEKGYTTYTCSCGDTYKNNYINPYPEYSSQNSSSSTEEYQQKLFQLLYKSEESKYILAISKQISPLENEVNKLKQEVSDNTTQYYKEIKILKEKFAALGMLNSGRYQRELEILSYDYKSKNQELSEKIDSLETQIAELKNEQSNPFVNNILSQLATNNNITYGEAVEKYNKYILN